MKNMQDQERSLVDGWKSMKYDLTGSNLVHFAWFISYFESTLYETK